MKTPNFGSLCTMELPDGRSTKPHVLPIYATSAFEFETINQGMDIFKGNIQAHSYGRYGNPTVDTVAKKIAMLESHGLDIDASAYFVGSGMAAISTLMMSTVKAGETILTQTNLYGGSTAMIQQHLEGFGVKCVMVDFQDLNKVEAALKADKNIRLIYMETPANPTMACVDLQAVSNLAKQYDCWTAVDNTFNTPYLQQPFKFGLDFIVHSTTKFLNGHGNSISGVIVGRDKKLMKERVWKTMKLIGTTGNPWDAWLTYNGIKTLEVRMERHCQNAMGVANFLEKHPIIKKVNYPGLASHSSHELAAQQMWKFGGMLSFELEGGFDAGVNFMNKIEFCTLAPTLGDVDTLILHPASMSHAAVPRAIRYENDITDGLVRMSVGIESLEDILADLKQALGTE